MKQIKPGTYTKSVCNWCNAPAEWRSSGLGLSTYACDTHRPELRQHEVARLDGHMTEGDYQSWYRR